VVKQDQLIRSDPGDYKRRRTIAIQRAHGGSCGFTLQVRASEGIRTHAALGWDWVGCASNSMEAFTRKLCCAALVKTFLVFSPARYAYSTSKLEPISDQYELICMTSQPQYVADSINASSSSSLTISIHMNIHVAYVKKHSIATHSPSHPSAARV